MKDLLIATTNPAKFAEYQVLLKGIDLHLISLREAGIDKEAPESGATFLENARTKASFYFSQSGIPALADDGGLEVDALGGAPGVRSHRWLGGAADDRRLAEEIVRRMAGVERRRRTARIRAAAVLIFAAHGVVEEHIGEAATEGIVAEQCYPDVRKGFPYRSVLYLPDRGCYLAEADDESAAHLSHRRVVVEKLTPGLQRLAAL